MVSGFVMPPSNPCVLVVDVQLDYFDLRNGIGTINKAFCVPGLRVFLRTARECGWRVIHVVTEHTGVESLPRLLREPPPGSGPPVVYCPEGKAGAAILDGIRLPHEPVVVKRGFSAFDGTLLEKCIADTDDVFLTGIAVDCCLLHSAFDAGSRFNKRVHVPFQAVSASTTEAYLFGLEAMSKSVARIIDLRDLLGIQDGNYDPQKADLAPKKRWACWYGRQVSSTRDLKDAYTKELESGVNRAVAVLEPVIDLGRQGD